MGCKFQGICGIARYRQDRIFGSAKMVLGEEALIMDPERMMPITGVIFTEVRGKGLLKPV
jgi:hypothetical protein